LTKIRSFVKTSKQMILNNKTSALLWND